MMTMFLEIAVEMNTERESTGALLRHNAWNVDVVYQKYVIRRCCSYTSI
jgi:hypothetical protein